MIDQSFLFCEIANPTNNLVYKSWVKKLSSGSCHGLENLGELCITETSLRRTLHHPGHDKRQDRNMMVKLALLSIGVVLLLLLLFFFLLLCRSSSVLHDAILIRKCCSVKAGCEYVYLEERKRPF